jgi:hypothetical protein
VIVELLSSGDISIWVTATLAGSGLPRVTSATCSAWNGYWFWSV